MSTEERRVPPGPRDVARLGVTLAAVLSGLMPLACVFFTVGPRGNISYRSAGRGTTLGAYRHPQATHPELETDFVDPAGLCNEDAIRKMHRVFGLLPAGVLLGLVALALTTRSGARARRYM